MNRNKGIELVWKTRYNRDVEAYNKIHFDDKEAVRGEVKVIYKGHEFFLTEYLKEGLTDYATVSFRDKTWKYDRVLDADTHIADLIGEIENA